MVSGGRLKHGNAISSWIGLRVARYKVPTLLLIGMRDTTALGKDRVSPEAAKTLGNYAALAPTVTARIQPPPKLWDESRAAIPFRA